MDDYPGRSAGQMCCVVAVEAHAQKFVRQVATKFFLASDTPCPSISLTRPSIKTSFFAMYHLALNMFFFFFPGFGRACASLQRVGWFL